MFKKISIHEIPLPLRALLLGIVLLCALSVFVFGVRYILLHYDYWQVEHALAQLRDHEYQMYFENHIDNFFTHEGIQGMINRTEHAYASGQIDMVACHSLAHDIGHYGGYMTNFPNIGKYLSKGNLDFCGSGFIHGVEAQLAYEPYPQNAADLYAFCKLIQPFHPYYDGCYHGAGHSFKEENKDPKVALSWCDKLTYDSTNSPVDCYRGVFSQTADDASKEGKDDTYLLNYCSSLKVGMQGYCAMELNGLNITAHATKADVASKLSECTDAKYSAIVKNDCVGSVANAAADSILSDGGTLVPPDIVYTFPDELIKTYITFTNAAFRKTANLEPQKNLTAFCEAFKKNNYYNYCVQVTMGTPVS